MAIYQSAGECVVAIARSAVTVNQLIVSQDAGPIYASYFHALIIVLEMDWFAAQATWFTCADGLRRRGRGRRLQRYFHTQGFAQAIFERHYFTGYRLFVEIDLAVSRASSVGFSHVVGTHQF